MHIPSFDSETEVKRAVKYDILVRFHFGNSGKEEMTSLVGGILLFLSLSIPAKGQGELARLRGFSLGGREVRS